MCHPGADRDKRAVGLEDRGMEGRGEGEGRGREGMYSQLDFLPDIVTVHQKRSSNNGRFDKTVVQSTYIDTYIHT